MIMELENNYPVRSLWIRMYDWLQKGKRGKKYFFILHLIKNAKHFLLDAVIPV